MTLLHKGRHKALLMALLLAFPIIAVSAEGEEKAQIKEEGKPVELTLPEVEVNASADASASGLSPVYVGGQVARGGRAGILGTRDNMDTPFSITSYTNELIQDKQAKSVGDVLLNDPSVRVARGFGNFQEAYFVRGFLLNSDDVAYNGLYSLLPRQYIATELFERVELLRGASAFLTGANPGGGGIGGAINLVPKRAGNEPLTRFTAGVGNGVNGNVAADISRRFGPDESAGVRVNVARRGGESSIDDEKSQLSLVAVAGDWHSPERDVRLSGDIGWQDNKLKRTRTNVSLVGLTDVPSVPDASGNYAQPGSFSNERDVFGTLRGEYDLGSAVTLWAAYGARYSKEQNSLANLNVTALNGDGNTSRFDNKRQDRVDTGELGIRGKFDTGVVGHEVVASAAYFKLKSKNAFEWDFFNTQSTNLYNPVATQLPAFSGGGFSGGDFSNLKRTVQTTLSSFVLSDTLSFFKGDFLLTGGARYQELDLRGYDSNTGNLTSEYSDRRVSPVVGAVYKLGKRWSVYGNYIEGLSQGETAPATAVNVGQQLSPYVSKQKEVGLKYDGGHFGAGVAYFSTNKPRSIVNAANVFTSSGEDQHQGLELTMFGEAANGLRVLGGVTLLDTEQKTTSGDVENGQRVIGVPELQANVGIEWDVAGIQGLTLDTRIIHTGSSYADAANTLKVNGWTRFDLGARYMLEMQDHLVTFRARVDNVTNRDYWASVGGFPGRGYLTIGAPRTFSLSGSIDF